MGRAYRAQGTARGTVARGAAAARRRADRLHVGHAFECSREQRQQQFRPRRLVRRLRRQRPAAGAAARRRQFHRALPPRCRRQARRHPISDRLARGRLRRALRPECRSRFVLWRPGRLWQRRPLDRRADLLSQSGLEPGAAPAAAATAGGARVVPTLERPKWRATTGAAARAGLFLGRTLQLTPRQNRFARRFSMTTRHAIVLLGLLGFAPAAAAQDFRIEDSGAARLADVGQLKPGIIAFSDQWGGDAVDPGGVLIRFEDWANKHPVQKKFLALFPAYVEPTIAKPANGGGPVVEKLYMYVAQARFVLDRAPTTIDLSRYVTLPILERIDPAIKHKLITAADVVPFNDDPGAGNDNPDRKWCTGRTTLICIQSSYKLEGKIPIGVLLVNKLRDSVKKVADTIDFQSELSAQGAADVDQPGLQELTALDTPVSGVIEQDLFYVNQIMKFGKLLAVFQNHPSDASKAVVTAFMALAIKARVLDEKRDYENVPVLRNLVPAQVLMGQSSFNSGNSISAGLPKYARNEISMIAGRVDFDVPLAPGNGTKSFSIGIACAIKCCSAMYCTSACNVGRFGSMP